MTDNQSSLPSPSATTAADSLASPLTQAGGAPGNGENHHQPPARPTLWPLWLAILILFLLLAVAAAGGWLGWQRIEQLQRGEQREWVSPADVQDRVDHLGDRLQARLDRLDAEAAAKQERIDTLQRQQDDTARRLLTADPTGRTDWLMAEAEYLLRLASQRLNMERDHEGTLVILRAADAVLLESGEVAVYPVRRAIAQEIASLESVSAVDRTGIFLQLEALIGQLENLDQNLFFKDSPLLEQPTPAQATPATLPDAEPRDWRERVDLALERLERYFVIRRRDTPVEPLLAPEQIYYLRQNLRLMLEQAELALLDRNQALYERSLDKASHWIRQYFLTNDGVTKAMLASLEQLGQQRIDPPLPQTGEALRVLKGLLESVYQRPPQTTPATPSESGVPPAPAVESEGGDA